MKYIFDFDDVLFYNTAQLKPLIFSKLKEVGVPEDQARAYYLEVREKEFSLWDFIQTLFLRFGINADIESLYQEIMSSCSGFLNQEIIKVIQNKNKNDIYIVTNGEKKFNTDKLKYSGILEYFKSENIFIVPGSKNECIEKICEQFPGEDILFIEDKPKFLDNLDFQKYPNLKTILYTGQKLDVHDFSG